MLRGSIDWFDAQLVLDELDEDQVALRMRIADLERVAAAGAHDHAARAALRPLHERLGDLVDVCDALARVQRCAITPGVKRAFVPDAPLADYVRGVYAWTHAVARALEELAFGIRRGERKTMPLDLSAADEPNEPDWATYRWRIEEAKNFHFHELERAIRTDLVDLAFDLDDSFSPPAEGRRPSKVIPIGPHVATVGADPPSSSKSAAHTLLEAFEALLVKARALESQLDLD